MAAYAGGLEPLLCLTKTDLASPQPLLDRYAGLGLDAVHISRRPRSTRCWTGSPGG